ncbi:MAG: homocysteine S-methyltransferase family protein, partial [Lachnospiraceae bacterium]|nr:homocysteine S-methyltransferase family protein [Lachnospiraceae bacterium]
MNERILILDGAMGTELVKAGAPMGKVPEELNITHPELIRKIHESYLAAGSNIIYTNTFGANPYKCRDSKYGLSELITAGVKIAREAAKPYNARVALSMGPIGDILEPFGNLKFEDAFSYYKEMISAGDKAGADILVFETQTDLLEVKAGVLAAKEISDLPIFVTMTFEEGGRTFTGTLVESAAITLDALGVSAVGVNCSLGPDELVPFVERMRSVTSLPLIVKPNAGLPDPVTGEYGMDAANFAEAMKPFIEMGVSYAGGCCGTAPDYIKALSAVSHPERATCHPANHQSYLCSARDFVDVTRVHVIGERINPTGKKLFKEALKNHDLDYIKNQAMEQVDAGAEILDVNVGLPGIDEKSLMTETVKELQAVVSTPLNIDSSDPAVIEAALRIYNGKALVNSVNGEDSTMDAILPLVKKYGAAVIGLTMDSRGIPATASERVEIAGHIVSKCKSYGIDPKDIYIDCLTLTVGTEQDKALETLKALKEVKERFGV